MPRLSLILLLLVAPIDLQADDDVPPPLRVVDIRGVVGDWIELKAETEGKIVRWRALDAGLRIAPDSLQMKDPRVKLAVAMKAGAYRVHAVTAKGDVPSAIVLFKVTVMAEPDPPSPPDPGPVPPGPTPPVPPPNPPTPPPPPIDPLQAEIRAALTADAGTPAEKRTWAAAAGGFYAAMAQHVATDQVATVGDMLSDYQAAIPASLPAGVIMGTRKLCGQKVAALVGDDAERKIDPALKTSLVDLFTKLSKALTIEGTR